VIIDIVLSAENQQTDDVVPSLLRSLALHPSKTVLTPVPSSFQPLLLDQILSIIPPNLSLSITY